MLGKEYKKMKTIRLVITTLLLMMIAACTNETKVTQNPSQDSNLISETVISEPDTPPEPEITPTPEPVIPEPESTPTPEPVISEPDKDPPLEPVIIEPENTLPPEPIISKPESTPTPEPIIYEPESTPTPEHVITEPENQQNSHVQPHSTPIPTPHGSHSDGNWTRIQTRNEFHDMLTTVNDAYEIRGLQSLPDIGERDFNRLKGTMWYYDFINLVDDVVLNEIRINHNYVTISYMDKNDIESATMVIQTTRGENVNTEIFFEGLRRQMSKLEDIIINNNPGLMLSDNGFNHYFWVENGHQIFVRVPTWLLDRYPEETFFNIHRIDIQ